MMVDQLYRLFLVSITRPELGIWVEIDVLFCNIQLEPAVTSSRGKRIEKIDSIIGFDPFSELKYAKQSKK